MPKFPNYATDFFAKSITHHDGVQSVDVEPSGHVRIARKKHGPIVIAPVSIDILQPEHVEQILADSPAMLICVVPKKSHYSWAARERAEELGASVHTMKEVYASLSMEDPRPHLNKDVVYQRDRLEQHDKVRSLHMVCEACMQLIRVGALPPVTVAVEYEYEFTEEALVAAIQRHRAAQAILNANPNGRPTQAALAHARFAGVGLFNLGELMGALNYDGDKFINYQPSPNRRR